MSIYICPKCNSTNTRLSQGTPPHALRWDCDDCKGWGWIGAKEAKKLTAITTISVLAEYIPSVDCEVTTDEPIRHTSRHLEGLNNDQAIGFTRIIESVNNKVPIGVFSRAGAGKTFMLLRTFLELKDQGKKVALTAPTHKAKNILMATASKFDISCFTIQQMLGLSMNEYSRKGKQLLRKTSDGMWHEYDVIGVDEASMCGSPITSEVPSGTRSIFVPTGDRNQLPPVNESDPDDEITEIVSRSKESPFFEMDNFIELTKIVRHDGAILKACTAICDSPDQLPPIQYEEGSLERLNGDKWDYSMLMDFEQRFRSGELTDNPDCIRVLAYQNDTVNRINSALRSHLFGFDAPCFCLGERLIAKEAIAKRLDRFSYEKTIILYSSTECVVLDMNKVYVQLNDLSNEGQVFRHELRNCQAINAYRLTIKTGLDEVYEICIIDKFHDATVVYVNNFFKQWKNAVLEFKNNPHTSNQDVSREWARYYEGLDRLTLTESKKDGYIPKLQPSFALTVHKSQGSTIDNVYLHRDILGCSDMWFKRKLVYTAFSRASKLLRVKGL